MSDLTRRSFLGVGAAAAATATAAAVPAALASEAPIDDDVASIAAVVAEAKDEATRAGELTTAESVTGFTHLAVNDTGNPGYWDEQGHWIPGWLIPPAVPEAADEELDCDVLVVGLGVSGLCAARAAVEAGAKVIAIEQSESYNCRAAQFGNVNSSYATESNVVFTPDDINGMMNAELQANGWRPNPRIWRYWLENSGEAFDWHVSANPDIIFLDPNLTPEESGIPGSAVPDSGMNGESTDGNMYMTCFNNPKNPEYVYADELYPMYPDVICFRPDQIPLNDKILAIIQESADVHFCTKCDQFIVDDSGAVVGAWATDIDGKVYKINAKSVVDACGDYGSNTEMRSYYNHESFEMSAWVWNSTDPYGNPTNMGSGLKMAAWAGAGVDFGCAAYMTHSFGGALGCDPFLLVNERGERFCNEDVPGHLLSEVAIRTPNKVVFQIFDDNYREQVHTMPNGHACYWKIVDDVEEEPWGDYIEKIGMRTPDEVTEGATAVCDTLDELAEALGCDAEGLKATVATYNEMAKAGFDSEFAKRADRLYPIEKPPFYGTREEGAFAFCMVHGVNADENCHALTANRDIVPGLYVAGNAMGSRFCEDYPTTIMGVSHGMAMTFGRLAGMNAAAQA
jgi:succinate dehydrogenase/fumarate reductase flavoprotein subunit